MKRDRRSRLPYRMRYRAGEYLLRTLVAGLGWLPASARPCIAWVTEQATYPLLWQYRKRMRDTLEQTLPDEIPTDGERRAVVRAAWRNFTHALVETFSTLYMTRDELRARIEIKGEDRLRAALARGKGVLALSAHFGNFTIIGPRLLAGGYDFSAVVKLPREARFAALQNEYCARAGVNIIPARPGRESTVRIIRALRRNEIVLLIPDEFKTAGVPVTFLGRPAPAPKGPVTIAERTGAAVLPVFMVRNPDNRLTLHVEPEIRFVETEDREADLRTNAALFVGEIEKMVRRHPDQWSWMGFRKPRARRASHAA